MGPRRLLVAAFLLVALSGGLYWSNRREAGKADAPPADAPPKMLEIPQDQINKIEIRRMGADPVLLAKDSAWKILSPKALPADPDAVSGVVSTLAVLTSERLVDEKPADLGPYGLKSPLLTVVVSRKDGKKHTLQIGDDAPSGSAAYAKLEGDGRLFLLPSSAKSSLEKTWRDLRDKHLLPFDSDKLTRVELTDKGASIEFGKNNANNWTILKPRPLRTDNFAAEELVRKLKEARMEVTNDTEEEATWPGNFAAGTPAGGAKVTDQNGTMQLEVRKGKDNAFYAKSSAVEGVFKTTSELGEGLSKGLDSFRNKKLFDFGFNQPASLEVKQDGKTFLFSKSGADWMGGGKKMDPGSVQQVLDRLRELTAVKFADAAAGAPFAEYTADKEHVIVSKQGDTFFARRANEPDVYVLDAAAVNEIFTLASAVKEIAPPAPAKK